MWRSMRTEGCSTAGIYVERYKVQIMQQRCSQFNADACHDTCRKLHRTKRGFDAFQERQPRDGSSQDCRVTIWEDEQPWRMDMNGCPQLGQAGYLVTYWSHRSCRENIHSHPWSRQKDCHYAEMVHNDWQRQITLRDHFAKTYRSCQETRETTPGSSRYHYTDRQAYLECPRP